MNSTMYTHVYVSCKLSCKSLREWDKVFNKRNITKSIAHKRSMRKSLVIPESVNPNLHSEKQENLNSKNNIIIESNPGRLLKSKL